jgi:transcriptional regulator with XRE-family HTH domain
VDSHPESSLDTVVKYHLKGRTQAWLAQASGVSLQHINGILTGRNSAGLKARRKIAAAFGLTDAQTLELVMAKFGGGK